MATKFRFLLDGVERKPLNAGTISINIERFTEAGAFDFRKFLSDKLMYVGQDYEFIISDSDICRRYVFEWQKFINGQYVEIFKGYFTHLNCTFNTNKPRCEVLVDIQPLDKYTCLLENWEKDVNVAAYGDATDAFPVSSTRDIVMTVASGVDGPNTPPTEDVNGNDPFLSYTDSIEYVEKTIVPTNPNLGPFIDIRYWIFCKERQIGGCINGVGVPPNADGNWNLFYDNCGVGGLVVWERDFDYTSQFTYQDDVSGEYYIQSLVIPFDPPPTGNWAVLYDDPANVSPRYRIWFNLDKLADLVTAQTSIEFVRGVREFTPMLDDIFNGYCGGNLVSEFLTATINPVTGTDNDYRNLLFAPISDIANSQSSTSAVNATTMTTVEDMPLKDIINDLVNLFNLRWIIDDSGDLRLEHITYFVDSLGIDLTTYEGGKWAKNKNTFSYPSGEIARRETWSFPIQSVRKDFKGVPIEYDGCGELELSYSLTRISTDLLPVIGNESARNSQGIILINLDSLNYFGSKWGGGIFLPFPQFPNSVLAISNLHDKLWRDKRALLNGTLNEQQTTFNSINPIKEQIDIVFPFCNPNDLKANEYIRTELGNGEIQSASYTPRTDVVTVKLKH